MRKIISIAAILILAGCGVKDSDISVVKQKQEQVLNSLLPSAIPVNQFKLTNRVDADGAFSMVRKFVDAETNTVCFILDNKSISCVPLNKEVK